MESSLALHSELVNNLMVYLTKVDPGLFNAAFSVSKEIFDANNVTYSLEGQLPIVTEANCSQDHMNEFYFSLVGPFEKKHGIERLWKQLYKINLKFYAKHKTEIKSNNLEIPISRYEFGYDLFDKIFGLSVKEISEHRWSDWPLYLSNQKIYLICKTHAGEEAFLSEAWRFLRMSDIEGKSKEILLQQVVTVGREIYVGREAWLRKASVRAIDYMEGMRMSQVVFMGKDDIVRDFTKVMSLLRRELKELSKIECQVLLMLTENKVVDDIKSTIEGDPKKVDVAVERLQNLNYITENIKPTSFGINTACELKQRMKNE